MFALSVGKSFSCQYMLKNVLISQINWVFSLCHYSSLLPVKCTGPWILPFFFFCKLWKLFSIYFLLLFSPLTQSAWPPVKSGVLPSAYLPASSCCLPSVSSASWLHLPATPTLPQKGTWAPQQNLDQTQSSCLEESQLHRAHPDRVSQRPKFQKQGTTPGKVNSAPDGC